jgi:hypothetical protein
MRGSYIYIISVSGPLDYYMIYGSVVQNYTFITSLLHYFHPIFLGYLESSMLYA